MSIEPAQIVFESGIPGIDARRHPLGQLDQLVDSVDSVDPFDTDIDPVRAGYALPERVPAASWCETNNTVEVSISLHGETIHASEALRSSVRWRRQYRTGVRSPWPTTPPHHRWRCSLTSASTNIAPCPTRRTTTAPADHRAPEPVEAGATPAGRQVRPYRLKDGTVGTGSRRRISDNATVTAGPAHDGSRCASRRISQSSREEHIRGKSTAQRVILA